MAGCQLRRGRQALAAGDHALLGYDARHGADREPASVRWRGERGSRVWCHSGGPASILGCQACFDWLMRAIRLIAMSAKTDP